ncbi:MAG: transcription elongation factor GreA [candidate division SR1 bacterium]|nr:transcription elongation factor GreA [candidate division SR1 bacterium]
MKKNFLTKEGYEELIQELKELKSEKLPLVLERLGEAKAMGDLSENFEYKSALEDKDFINSRIVEIESLIEGVEIIKEDNKKLGKGDKVVDYGAKVTLNIEDDGKFTVVIVGTGETAIEFDTGLKALKDGIKISFESPMGMAIRGKKVGEVVRMRLANGKKEVKILDIN